MEFKEQIQRILENVPKVYEAGSSSIKNEVSNALKGSASGEVVALKDVSPLEHILKVKISGVDNPEAVKLLVSEANLLSLDKFSWSTNCTLSNGVVTQINADTNTSPTFKIAGNGYAELARSGVISRGRLALEFVCTEQTDNLYFGVHGNAEDTALYFAGVNLRAGTYTFSCEITNATQGAISWKDMQIEGGGLSDYKPYKEPIEYAQGEDIKSISPCTTIMTDTKGAVVEVEYNRDLNKAFAELYQAIISLGGNV